MPLDEKTALEILREMRDAYEETRHAADAYWALAMAYDAGRQWSRVANTFGQQALLTLPRRTDPNSANVRTTLDKIHEKTSLISRSLKPARLNLSSIPQNGSPKARVLTSVCDDLLQGWAKTTGALDVLREKDDVRCTLGTGIIRRCLSSTKIAESPNGSPIRSYRLTLSSCYPWEFIRDPSARTRNVAKNEEFLAHCKIRPASWVKRNFGIDPKATRTISELDDLLNPMFKNSSYGQSVERKGAKGVVVYEAWFKDPDLGISADPRRDWPWYLVAYCDPTGNRDIIPLLFTRNPYYGLPIHFFHYDTIINTPWGRGVPHLLIPRQDNINLAMTWLMRRLITGCGKVVFEKGTVEDPANSLDPNPMKPLVWKREGPHSHQQGPPNWMTPPPVQSAVNDVMAMLPGEMNEAVHIADVQRGITSSRGESGQAVELKLSAANAPMESLKKDDELVYEELLYATLVDLTNPYLMQIDKAREYIDRDVDKQNLMMLFREPIEKSIRGVQIKSESLRERTPAELRSDAVALVSSQIIDAETARMELLESGSAVNTLERMAYEKQQQEIAMMRDGYQPEVTIQELHAVHVYVLQRFANSKQWLDASEEVKSMVTQHWVNHQMAAAQLKMTEAMLAAPQGMPSPGMPSPPSAAIEAAQDGSMGTAQPQIA